MVENQVVTVPPTRGTAIVVLLLLVTGGFLFWSNMDTPAPPAPQAPVAPVPVTKIELYFFTSKDCIHCKTVKNAMETPEVREALKRFDLHEVRGDRAKERRFKVRSYPTLVAVSSKGVSLHAGGMDSKDLAAWLNGIQ